MEGTKVRQIEEGVLAGDDGFNYSSHNGLGKSDEDGGISPSLP